jgi:Acetyltransferase (GNAT) domain
LVSGYADPRYAGSLAEFGQLRMLPRSQGCLLERPVADGARDLMGPYPLFACHDWAGLAADLAELEERAVSVVLVADPLGDVGQDQLGHAFPDLMRPYKLHHVRDHERPWQATSHHRRHLRRAAAAVEVDVCVDPARYLDDWMGLYATLIERHGLVGIRAFSRTAFERQLALPGLVAVRAERDGLTVGMTLWLEDPPCAHYHLGAYSSEGYDVSASYAVFDRALGHLRDRGVRWIDIGGSAGDESDDGLDRFKRGWANQTRTAHLCGRVLDRDAYRRLTGGRSTDWFPAYRASERDLGGT